MRWSLISLLLCCGGAPISVELTDNTLRDFTTGRTCNGPAALLLLSDDPGGEEAWQEFEAAADDTKGLACFGWMQCSRGRSCHYMGSGKEHQLVLFPRDGAARPFRARLHREPIIAGIARILAEEDRSVSLTNIDEVNAFLTDSLQPLKVILFSGRKKTPAVLQSLSNDPLLWPHVHFGFAGSEGQDNGRGLRDLFGISTVPSLIFQFGSQTATREVYQGELSIEALQLWVTDKLWLLPEITEDTGEVQHTELDLQESPYEILPKGEPGCPPGLEILSFQECVEAVVSLGLLAHPPWVSNFPGLPAKCSVREDPTEASPERMHFNSAAGGAGRADLSPVCKRPQAVAAPPPLPADKPPAVPKGPPASEAEAAGAPAEVASQAERSSAAEAPNPPPEAAAALRSPAAADAAPSRESQPSAKVPGLYMKMDKGVRGCPPGLEITSVDECKVAVTSLGLPIDPAWVSAYPNLPRFCSVRENPAAGSLERLHFNSAAAGQGRNDLAPVCRTVPVIPELSKQSALILDVKGFFFIYLKDGRLLPEEGVLLNALRSKYQEMLSLQGIKLHWVWLDLRADRSLKSVFDPPVLPSAVILNPHSRPRFVAVQHPTDGEDDPLPVDPASMEKLITKLLDGEAHFKPIPGKKLASWMGKSSSSSGQKPSP